MPRPAPSRRRTRVLAAALLAGWSLIGAGACGATRAGPHTGAGTHGASTAVGGAARSSANTAVDATRAPAGCAQMVAATLGGIAARIYHEAASGGDVQQAVHRLQSSVALRSAVSAGDAGATRAALVSLLVGQIERVEVLRAGRRLASAGSGSALAPVSGTLPGTGGGRFVLSVQSDRTFLRVTSQVTGAEVLLLAGRHLLGGTLAPPAGLAVPTSGPLSIGSRAYEVASVSATRFPSAAVRVALLVPAAAIGSCPSDPAQARAAVLGRVGERIYEEEQHSPTVTATVAKIESSAAFRSAVTARDAAATRAAIVGFFRAHLHVVRVRVTVGGQLLVDVGGPYALAPVAGAVRSGGRVVGRFLMAIQDDAGYEKLARLFTGAQVLMRLGSQQVMGTLQPGPATVPDRGAVSYGGRSYHAYSFAATAFPSGRLRISLLF